MKIITGVVAAPALVEALRALMETVAQRHGYATVRGWPVWATAEAALRVAEGGKEA